MEDWRTQVASDIQRDGLGLELLDLQGNIAAEVFRCDADHSVTVTVFVDDVPPQIITWLCELAQTRLGPSFEDGVTLPDRRTWTWAAA